MQKIEMVAATSELGLDRKNSDLFTSIETQQSAALMVDAYEGTVDWQPGDTQAVAADEIENTIAGKYGHFISNASLAIVDESALPIAEIVCAVLDDQATILFVYTAKQHKCQGLAEQLIRQAAFELAKLEHETVRLFVTTSNPAISLYRRLGFKVRS